MGASHPLTSCFSIRLYPLPLLTFHACAECGIMCAGGFSTSDKIVIDPQIQHVKPVIRGTRVPVARIVGGLAGGMTKEKVMCEYGVGEEDVLAALRYAAQLIETKVFHPLPVPA